MRCITWRLSYRNMMLSAPSKCEVLGQDRQKPVFVLTACGDCLEVITNFKYIKSYITPSGGDWEDVPPQTMKLEQASRT